MEPSAAKRAEAQRRHAQPRIRWIPGRLPGLEHTSRAGLPFDFLRLSAGPVITMMREWQLGLG
jgi:hypothetical protein